MSRIILCWTCALLVLGTLKPRPGVWTLTGSMNMERIGHTATLLPDGQVLVAGGDTAASEAYDPATGAWTVTAAMSVYRFRHTATSLLDGRVLVAGGGAASAEIFDPATGAWSPAGTMTNSRSEHTATRLPDGRVLVAGGISAGDILAGAEIFDPATGAWTPVAAMTTRRCDHTATLLPNGTVLVTGGVFAAGAPADSAELYDPSSDTWTKAGTAMSDRRSGHTATLLPDGTVLLAGGWGLPDDTVLPLNARRTAEIYDPAEDTWTPVGSMRSLRTGHTATLLPSGGVLVAGGMYVELVPGTKSVHDEVLALSEVYDPAARSWAAADDMNASRDQHTATLLSNGEVLATGGPGASTELYHR